MYILAAEDAEQMNTWISRIKHNIEMAQAPTPGTTKSFHNVTV
jgi:hypothetical protein